ncbi:MAG: hypothetical protein ACN2B6_02755 [Rickettsiales bacterium]
MAKNKDEQGSGKPPKQGKTLEQRMAEEPEPTARFLKAIQDAKDSSVVEPKPTGRGR